MISPPFPLAPVVSPTSRLKLPPLPILPVPSFKFIDPDLPFNASPVDKLKPPLLPELVVPVVNVNDPLTPFAPEFGVVNTNDPLDVDFDHPLAISMLPPFPVKASPATTDILPPSSDRSVPLL